MFWRRYGSRSCVIWQGGEMDLSGSGKTLHSDSPNNINICFLHFDMWLTVTYKINAYRSRAKSKLGYLPFNVLLWPGIFYWEKKNNIKKRTFYFSIFLSVCTINSCKLPLKKKTYLNSRTNIFLKPGSFSKTSSIFNKRKYKL